MEKQFPGSREHSLFASVELSLRRMSPANRERAKVLGVFHGGVDLNMLRAMTQWEDEDVGSLAVELTDTGLATPDPYNHLMLNPALCPYLRGKMDVTERATWTDRWCAAMGGYVLFLDQERSQNTELAATLTVLELPNLFALLDQVQRAGNAEATIDLATSLYSLLRNVGKPRLLERVGQVRDAAANLLGDAWSHARFEAARTQIEQQLADGRLREAFEGAQQLLHRAQAVGGQAFPFADYDQAIACFLLARVFDIAGSPEQALPLLDEARQRFEAVAKERANKFAERMATVCFSEKGRCLLNLGRLDEAAMAFEESIRRSEQLDGARVVAVVKSHLGTLRRQQRRYPEALKAYEEAREQFTQLNEPGSVAVVWHQTGVVYQDARQPQEAEDAYRKSLAINVRLGDVAGQATTLNQLGLLYNEDLGRTEEAIAFLRQAVDKSVESGNLAKEGTRRYNLATCLRKIRHFAEARQEILRAIKCDSQFGHTSETWKTWSILADIETDAGNPIAAAEAKRKAIACYLAYRCDGGENHDGPGRLCHDLTQLLLTGDGAAAASFLEVLVANPDAAKFLPFIHALQAVVTGSRDRTLADAPDLHYTEAAEILYLIETLEKPQ
jgi:tetratricopeptide (TPR) repeat protein